MEQVHEQVDGVLTAGQHAPDGRARVVRALRYLADEVEAGRAVADIDFNIDTGVRPKPQRWEDAGKPAEYERYTNGARWRITAATVGDPCPAVNGEGPRDMDYAALRRLSFTPLERTRDDFMANRWRYRDTAGRVWTVQTLGMSEPGYDPQIDDASCGKCNRNLSPLDLPAEHAPSCKGARPA